MGMYKKIDNNTLQKLAGYTVIADGSCAEVRSGNIALSSIAPGVNSTTHVTFSDPMPDTDYDVFFSVTNNTSHTICMVKEATKTVNGFDFYTTNVYTSATTPGIHWVAVKLITMEGYTELKNKVDNPDTTPTENSTNLCTSGGIYDFVKNASSIFVGTSTEWASATQTDYDIAVITDEHKILSIDKTAGTTDEQANLNKIFRGTLAEWEALSQTEKDYYDQAEIDDDQYMTNVNQIVAHDKVVAVADWQADATYTGFNYKAEISMPGVTADYSPDVRLSFDDIGSGIFAPVADAAADKVIIYASAVPAAAITIPVIICTLMSV